eukprot:COSAG02_NODE_3381_length_6837_cov_83.054022_5_plen_101_part_00
MAELHGAFPRDCCRCGSHDAHGDSAEAGCLGKRHVAKGRRKYAFGQEQDKLDAHFIGIVHVELGKSFSICSKIRRASRLTRGRKCVFQVQSCVFQTMKDF